MTLFADAPALTALDDRNQLELLKAQLRAVSEQAEEFAKANSALRRGAARLAEAGNIDSLLHSFLAEAILASGLLGPEAPSAYARLGDSDRGHVREEYLSLVEQVAPELRAKHLKVYAYY